jgi:hypothetical protein
LFRRFDQKSAHRDGENTVRNDDRSDGIFLKLAARLLLREAKPAEALSGTAAIFCD